MGKGGIIWLVAAAVAIVVAATACSGGMTEREALAAVDTVEAHYRAYATDSADLRLIAAADRRLDRSGTDPHTRARALLCHGAVLDELGDPDSALVLYKRAEAVADTTDHPLLGHVNLRIASLYHGEYAYDGNVLERYLSALTFFKKAENVHYQLVCLEALTQLYDLSDKKTAAAYADSTARLAKSHGKMDYFYRANGLLSQIYFYGKEYAKANRLAVSLLSARADTVLEDSGNDCVAIAARTHALLGRPDSAMCYFKLLPPPANARDSMRYFLTLADVEKSAGDYAGQAEHYKLGDDIADSLLLMSQQYLLRSTENQFERQSLKLAKIQAEYRNSLYFAGLLLLTSIVSALGYSLLRYRRRIQHVNAENTEARRQLQQTIDTLTHINQSLALTETELFKSKADLKDAKTLLKTNRLHIQLLQNISQSISLRKRRNGELCLNISGLSEGFWDDVYTYANLAHDGIITDFKKQHMADEGTRFVGLCCLGVSNTIIKVCMDYTSLHYVSNKKASIARRYVANGMSLDEYIASQRS